jgi:hypothetical protein
MYQVTFSDQSSKAFKALPIERQLKIVGELSELPPAVLEKGEEPLGRFERAGIVYYRYRTDDLRFYFILKEDTILCVHIMNKNTWADFRLRANLEKLTDAEVETRPNFLNLLDGEN